MSDLGWSGDHGKVYSLHECPDCGEARLRVLRGTEAVTPIGFCGACGAVLELTLTRHTSELDLINDKEADHPGDATVDATDVTVREIVEKYERGWTRYELADEFEISVIAALQAITYYLKAAGDAYDDPKRNFAYHFLGAGTAEWRDEWDGAGAAVESGPVPVSEVEADSMDEGDAESEVTVRTQLSMLKHERNLQFAVVLQREYPDPKQETETLERIADAHAVIPNGFYREVEEALVETAAYFADYHEDSPET